MSARRRSAVVPLAVALLLLTGCGLSIPTDPDGTLDRVRSSEELRVGASPSGGWVEVTGAEAPGGHEARLVESFAEDLGVDVAWTVAGEEHLVTMLEDGELDLAVGGFTDSNAWVDKVGLTRPYAEVDVDGSTEAHVMMVPMGENDLQSTLERWLDDHGGAP